MAAKRRGLFPARTAGLIRSVRISQVGGPNRKKHHPERRFALPWAIPLCPVGAYAVKAKNPLTRSTTSILSTPSAVNTVNTVNLVNAVQNPCVGLRRTLRSQQDYAAWRRQRFDGIDGFDTIDWIDRRQD